MDFSDTQIYEDEDFLPTQRILLTSEEKDLIQIGTLSINSAEYQVKTGITKIGRLSSCDIVINDATISKKHAEIEASTSQGSTWICDLKSSNKTKLNDQILRPTRWYELKDGSVIEFGKVRAVYRTYRPTDDTVIPETPAPKRQKVTKTIIPNTPDSSLNNSSNVDDDGSVIYGTQKDDENTVFRRPQIPQHQSKSIDKKSANTSRASSMSESDDSQIGIALHMSSSGNNESQQDDIFDMKTQEFHVGHKAMMSNPIHDLETQKFSTYENFETNVKDNKRLSNIRNKITENSAANIHDMETQNYMDNVDQQWPQKSDVNITAKKLTMNMHDIETQNYINANDKGDIEIQKFTNDKNEIEIEGTDRIERNIHNLETQKFDNEHIAEDISDMETQLGLDAITNETNNQINKNKTNISDAVKGDTNYEDVTNLSRSSSPGSLNFSSPGVYEDVDSLSNQSAHLLESSDLLEYFGDGIDKQGKIQVSNASTPKSHSKMLTEKDNSARNVSDTSTNEDDHEEENIFDVATQRVSKLEDCKLEDLPSDIEKDDELATCKNRKKKCKKPSPKPTNDDSETDAEEYLEELEKQRESLENSNTFCNKSTENRNDPGTSAESEDMFNMPTQRLTNCASIDTFESSTNELSKASKTDITVDNAAPTQIINTIENTRDQNNISKTLSADTNATAPTRIILPREASPKTVIDSKASSSESNQNDVDDTAATQIINTNRQSDATKSIDFHEQQNLDHEDIEYEMAPTQVVGEEEEEEEKKRNYSVKEKSDRETIAEPSKVDLNDTLERNLHEMFDDIHSDKIHEPSQLSSTQCLEDILQLSQSNNDLSRNRLSIVNDASINNVPQTKIETQTCASSRKLSSIEANKNNVNQADTDSQNSDIYFSTITTRRKRNVIKDTQEFINFVESDETSPQNDSNFPQTLREYAKGDSRSNKKEKRASKARDKSDATINDLIHDNIRKTTLSENNERNVQKSKSTKQKDRTASKTTERVSTRNSRKVKVDDAEKHSANDTSAPCTSENVQCAQVSNISYENDDDILIRLPAVRISGTFSNPPSPSGSSTSTVHSTRSKKSAVIGRSKRNKSLHKRDIEEFEKNENLPRTNDKQSTVSSHSVPQKIDTFSSVSEDSDSETNHKRFKQMANRILNNELNYLKEQRERNVRNTKKSSIIDKKSTDSLSDTSKDSKQNIDVEGSRRSLRFSSRTTRYSNRNNDESSYVFQVTKQVCTDKVVDKSEAKVTGANRKRSLKVVEEDVEQTNSKKSKADKAIKEHPLLTRSSRRNTAETVTGRQTPNILDNRTETNSRTHSPVIGSVKSSEGKEVASKPALKETQKVSLNLRTRNSKDESIDSEKSSVKRTRRQINDNQVTININDVTANASTKDKQQEKEKKTEAGLMQDKVLRVFLNPIIDNESQEIEMIMRNAPSNVQDENLSIRKESNVRILRQGSRSAKTRKRFNLAEADSASTESNASSDTSDSNMPKTKRGRLAKSSVSLLQGARVPEKMEVFKRPTRINQNSSNSILNTSTESSNSGDSQDSTKSNISSSTRSSRAKAASIKKAETNQSTPKSNMADNSTSSGIGTSAETTNLFLTPSRTRKSMSSSILSNSSPSVGRPKILFTGITENKYSKIVKTLGGSKVEDPAKCTVLVTDKVRRTYKFLCALAKGVPIVAIDWLRDSESSAQFLEWESYILKDPVAEAKFGFRLRKSLDKAKEKKLLDGYTVILTPGVAPPPIEELKNMVTSCGGKVLLRPPSKWPDNTVIVSREEDLPNAKKFLAKAPKTVTIQSTEFILTGILRQETDFVKYRLT